MPNVRTIVKNPDSVLRKSASDVAPGDIANPEIQELIADMKATLQSTPDGVGLAAPQIGESLCIFIVSEEAEEIDKADHARERGDAAGDAQKPYEVRDWKYYVFINPVVKKKSRSTEGGSEGCLSVPGKYGAVKRQEKLTVEALDEHGKKFTRGASHFFARVMQHELDHLEGALFIDKVIGPLMDDERER